MIASLSDKGLMLLLPCQIKVCCFCFLVRQRPDVTASLSDNGRIIITVSRSGKGFGVILLPCLDRALLLPKAVDDSMMMMTSIISEELQSFPRNSTVFDVFNAVLPCRTKV